MADSLANSPALIDAFHLQSEAGAKMGSPFMERLCRLFAERGLPESATRDLLAGWSGNPSAHGEALPVRLCAALHELVLSGADSELATIYPPHHEQVDDGVVFGTVSDAIGRNDEFLVARMGNPPQTNEIRRSSAVYAALLHIRAQTGLPVRLSEVGASAGLNLLMDRFRHVYDGDVRGSAGSSVSLTPQWSGSAPPEGNPEIVERRGCDLMPFDLSLSEDRMRLLSYKWADQKDRIDRMRAAMEIAAASPPIVDRADAVEWLHRRLQEQTPGRAHVLYHTIAWQYLPEGAQRTGSDLIRAAGKRATERAPFFLVSLEMDGASPGAGLHQTSWPGGHQKELARVDTHGRWITWH